MTTRRTFIKQLSALSIAASLPHWLYADNSGSALSPLGRLVPVGRALELEGYYVWCSCPIEDDEGKVHIFFSRWLSEKGMGGWIKGSEIAHAVADSPAGEFKVLGTVIAPREGFFDATTCHNPLVVKEGSKFYLFYMGNSNGKTDTKRIGLAISDSLYGPWQRNDTPLLEAGDDGAWDDHCTTNPAFVKSDNGQYLLYYKSWNTKEYEQATGPIRGNRKYGLAIAEKPEGPYVKYKGNPVIDFSGRGANRQFEDAFIWKQHDRYNIIARDMGVFNHEVGLLMDSKDGFNWSAPKIAYNALSTYINMPPAPKHLKKYGRLERPMLLITNNKPQYLFGAAQGGRYNTSSTFIFKIEQ